MKQWNFQNDRDALEALVAAFEHGYRLGRSDGREGVFIDMLSLVEQFLEEQYSDSIDNSVKQDR